MSIIKTGLSLMFVLAVVVALIVAPFVIFYWGLGASVVMSIIGSWAWSATCLLAIILSDKGISPRKPGAAHEDTTDR